VNAKEAEAAQESKKFVSKTKQRPQKRRRKTDPGSDGMFRREARKELATEDLRRDQGTSDRMVDEGDPNPRPRGEVW
jgi:hypothetical protein